VLPFYADTEFWRPQPVPEERLVCSVGLEFRDYPTVFRAAQELDARVVVAASSLYSKRRNTALSVPQPPNVEVGRRSFAELRDLYARAAVVVVPLADVDMQAGLTTICEAMAMGKPVVVTQTRGQTDIVQDRRAVTRGAPPHRYPPSLLEPLAAAAGMRLEPNGFYVPPGDHEAMRRAIVYLLDHPEERARLGAAGRRLVERLLTVDQYAQRIREIVLRAAAGRSAAAPLAPTTGRAHDRHAPAPGSERLAREGVSR
jgi:glycosyltransferase involved in cell wall biosynthesis